MEQSTVYPGYRPRTRCFYASIQGFVKELLDETKADILIPVPSIIDLVFSDFDMVAIENEVEGSIAGIYDPCQADKIDSFIPTAEKSQ